MWSGLSAAAKEGLEDGLSGLERLKKNLQSAAVMCQPAGAAGAVVFETELEASFDSADLDEEDPDEGVGVDERAALLQPEDFFVDDEDWYASARWLMERPQTEDFITTALLTHMAPLYVPYADIRARTAKEVVPVDVQREMRSFAIDFVSETNLRSCSVKDVKEGIGEGLGAVGFTFIPQVGLEEDMRACRMCSYQVMSVFLQEVAPYDHPAVDALLHAGGEPLGFFSEKFEDTDESWSVWHGLLTGTYEEDDEDEDDDDDDDDDGEGSAGSQGAGGGRDEDDGASVPCDRKFGQEAAAHDAACAPDHDELAAAAAAAAASQMESSAKAVQTEEDEGLIVEGGEKALREMVVQVLAKSCPEYYSSKKVALGRQAEEALSFFVSRLQQGRNARNALMLLRRTACHPLPPPPRPRPLCLAVIWQAYLKILIAGPMRSIRLESEDLPPAAVKVAYDCAAKTAEASGAWEAGEGVCEEALLLDRFISDEQALGGVAGWCLKFLFEGLDSLHDVSRRRSAFRQFALEAKYGPLKGVAVAGENEWVWDESLVPCDEALRAFAESYGETFALAHGDTLGSILDAYLEALSDAGFKECGAWSCDVWRPKVEPSPVKKKSPSKHVAASGPEAEGLPAFGDLPVPVFADLPPPPPGSATSGAASGGVAAVEQSQSVERNQESAAAARSDASSVEAVGAALQVSWPGGREGLRGGKGEGERLGMPAASSRQAPPAPAVRDAVW